MRVLPFLSIILYFIGLRIIELKIARSNTATLKSKGAIEFGEKHYWILIALHTTFFVCLIFEWILSQKNINRFWPLILMTLFTANAGRFWIIRSMEGRWSTKIIVPAQISLAEKYRTLNLLHLKYIIVVIELIALPLLFNLYWTTVSFTVLNAVVLLKIRIPEENSAFRRDSKQAVRTGQMR